MGFRNKWQNDIGQDKNAAQRERIDNSTNRQAT